jgi:DNA-binding LytR/AlgR family response regulator
MPHAATLPFSAPGARPGLAIAGSPMAAQIARSAEPARRIAVRSARAYWIVALDAIVRVSADDNYVVVRADREYRQKCTLDAFLARLDPARFVRVHRSHAVNVAAVRELAALGRGEYRLVLRDDTTLRTGRRFAAVVVTTFGLDA